MKNIISIIAGLLFTSGFIPYVYAILRKRTKPTKASWIIWAFLDAIIISGMYAKNAVNEQIIGAFIGALVVAALSFKYGISGWTRLDKFCLAGAILGIIFWKIFSNPSFGIIISLSVMFLGAIPTFASAWKDPGRENKLAWTIFWLSCVCAVIAIPRWTLADAAQPIKFFITETIMMYILFRKRR